MFRFDFAISYAGGESGIAGDLVRLLQEGGAVVFFARNEEVYLLGKRLTSELPYAFGPHSKFVVPIVSKHYVQKHWTRYEFAVAKVEEQKRDREFILPVRLDDVDLAGLEEDVLYIDVRREGLFNAAEILMRKLREIYPIEEVAVPKVWVATFGVNMEDLVANYELPPSAPTIYAHLCDWLEDDLIARLSASSLEGLTLLEDLRTGETLSVRVGFKWDPNTIPLDFGDTSWWEVLEIAEFESAYEGQDWKEILEESAGGG